MKQQSEFKLLQGEGWQGRGQVLWQPGQLKKIGKRQRSKSRLFTGLRQCEYGKKEQGLRKKQPSKSKHFKDKGFSGVRLYAKKWAAFH
mmetsp:Transcript_57839/g.84612  ORF Transcript_57839/g.84612 Transcript_57839/m.84612 type:complete len:88 (+) Transcript_57839:119-382(+)